MKKNEDNTNSLVDRIKNIVAAITGLIGLVTIIYQFTQLWFGDRETITWIIGGLGYLVTLGILIYIGYSKTEYLAKTIVPHQWFERMTYEKYYKASRKGLLLLIVLSLIGGILLYQQDKEERSTFVVVIADFGGPDPQNYRVTDKLLFNLTNELNGVNDILVIPLNKTVNEQDGSVESRKIAKKYRADLLIWG